jgi:membrane fusion protein, multidrug efflux system
VITPELTASKRLVRLGEIRGGNVEVLDGLNAGDRIATAGVSTLRDNMKVRDLGNALGGK